MNVYRLYVVSGLTGRFEPALEVDVSNDEAALRWADDIRALRDAELWYGSRLVKQWNSEGGSEDS
jgi:hypothetical protein